jgi:hypothetical protein
MPVLVPDGWESFDGGATSCGDLSLTADGDFDCAESANVVITLTASGGVPPYTWDTDKGIVTGISATQAELVPAANPGSAVPGPAYGHVVKYSDLFCNCSCIWYKCDDSLDLGCQDTGCGTCWILTGGTQCSCATCEQAADVMFRLRADGDPCGTGTPQLGSGCAGLSSFHRQCDSRTAGMISGGCNPCAISMEGGAVVTVTDSLGNEAFVAVDSL